MARIKQPEAVEMPMSAMIDVTFLLLIFFIVTATDEIIEAHVSVDLPSASSSKSSEKPPQLIEVVVPPDSEAGLEGKYLLMGSTPHDIDALEQVLAGVAVLDNTQTIIIKVSPDATQGKLIQLLDRCKKVGLSKLNVLTLKV
jgi:biopolymer transport protein ExbD